MINLRKYQVEAIKATLSYLYTHSKGNPLIVMPTGSGKTHVIGGLCQQLEKISSKNKVVIVSHVEEILKQDASKLKEYISRDKVGVYSAGIGLKQIRQFTVASIQTVCNCPEKFKDVKYVIVDEAHRIPESGTGQYRKFFKQLPFARIIGLTATPYRLGHGSLVKNHLFHKIAYDCDILNLIKQGYLTNLITKQPKNPLNTSKLKVVAGDFSKRDMTEKLDKQVITKRIINEVMQYREDRKHWIIFAIDIAHAEHISTYLSSLGISCAALHSKMDKEDRVSLIDLFKAGHIQCLVSVEILTTGFDAPHVDLIVLMRPTKSPVLHVQMIGRGMRPHEDKKNCLVLDFAGNTKRLGPINDVFLEEKTSRKESKGEAPPRTKTCPKCAEIIPIAKKECPECKYVFPIKSKLLDKPDQETQILKTKAALKIKEYKVSNIMYTKHEKPGRPPSLKVSYVCGLRVFNEWIALEHEGYAKYRAESWWKYRTGLNAPGTVDKALTLIGILPSPITITVDETQKFPQIIRHDFTFTRA